MAKNYLSGGVRLPVTLAAARSSGDLEKAAKTTGVCMKDGEIGDVIEQHMLSIGMLKSATPDQRQQEFIDAKRQEFEDSSKQQDAFATSDYPEGSQMCGKCSTVAVIMMDGCMTCLSCGDSKCG